MDNINQRKKYLEELLIEVGFLKKEDNQWDNEKDKMCKRKHRVLEYTDEIKKEFLNFMVDLKENSQEKLIIDKLKKEDKEDPNRINHYFYKELFEEELDYNKNKFLSILLKKIEETSHYRDLESKFKEETGVILEYTGRIDRNGYKYYSNKENCNNCPEKAGCCNKKEYRTITRHICEELNEEMRERRLSERGRALYKQRKEKIERSFADSKNNHGYRYAMYKGIEKNQNYTWLICAAQNVKNIAIKKEKIWG